MIIPTVEIELSNDPRRFGLFDVDCSHNHLCIVMINRNTRSKLFGLFDFDCSYNDALPWWLDYIIISTVEFERTKEFTPSNRVIKVIHHYNYSRSRTDPLWSVWLPTVVIMMHYLDDSITQSKLFGLFDFDCSYNDVLPWWLDYSE
jgi:hypothetical protein